MSVPLFVNHWQRILEHYPAWRVKYPDGPAKDKTLIFQGNDFVLASQVLLDLASHFHALSSQESVYDAGFNSDLVISNNTLRGAVCGVSLYRTWSSRISNNTISASVDALAMYGVELGMSHNVSIDGNRVSGSWHAGLIAQGAAIDDPRGCGPCQAHLGASFNTLSHNDVIGAANGIVLGFGMNAGSGNVVHGNTVSNCQSPCNYSNAGGGTQAAGNSPRECNFAR
jgi:parallel beta-helix repeat protein